MDKRRHPELQLCRDSVRFDDDIRQLQQARQQYIQVRNVGKIYIGRSTKLKTIKKKRDNYDSLSPDLTLKKVQIVPK